MCRFCCPCGAFTQSCGAKDEDDEDEDDEDDDDDDDDNDDDDDEDDDDDDDDSSFSHFVKGAWDDVPSGHILQAASEEAATMSLNFPATQVVQVVEPAALWKRPAKQSLQDNSWSG